MGYLDMLEKSTEFEDVTNMPSVKKQDLKKTGLGNKPNEAQPLEDDQIEKM